MLYLLFHHTESTGASTYETGESSRGVGCGEEVSRGGESSGGPGSCCSDSGMLTSAVTFG